MKKPKANRLSEETKNLILRLFKEGLRQRDICEKFNLGKSTVNYIVRPKTRERTKERQQKRRTVFVRKIDSFFDRQKKKIKDPRKMWKRPERRFKNKVRSIFRDANDSSKGLDMKTREQQVRDFLWPLNEKDKYGNEFPYTVCNFTGKTVSVMASDGEVDAMSFDHIVAVSKGGANSLTNIQPLSQRVNEMKKNDTNEEFFSRVRDVEEGPAYKEWLSKR